MKHFSTVLFTVCLVAATATAARGEDGFLPIAFGARSHGLGGVMIGNPTDAMAIAVNPAGLVMQVGNRIDISGFLTFENPTLQRDNGEHTGTPELYGGGPNAAYCHRFGKETAPVVLGGGIFTTARHFFRTDLTSDYSLYSRYDAYRIAPVVAYQPVEWLGIGLSPYLEMANMGFRTVMADKYVTLPKRSPPVSGLYSVEADTGYSPNTPSLGLTEGLLFMPLRWLRFGLAATTPIYSFKFMRNLTITGLNHDFSLATVPESIRVSPPAGFSLPLPFRIGGGVAAEIGSTVLLGLDVGWIDWNYHYLRTDFTLNSSRGSNEAYLALPLHWSPQTTLAGGVQYNPIRPLALRLGANYGSQFANSLLFAPALSSGTRLTAGIGGQYKIFAIDASFEHQFPVGASLAQNNKSLYGDSTPPKIATGHEVLDLMVSFAF